VYLRGRGFGPGRRRRIGRHFDRQRSVQRPSSDGGKAGQRLEILEEQLRQGGELGSPADVIEIRHEPPIGAVDNLPAPVLENAAGLEHHEVPEELFAIEVRQSPSLLRVQATSKNPTDDIGPTISGWEPGCQ
jgi:hypothetical protein